ncbi:hypothetical protein [Pseudomonas putida]|uniref:hypothetical protein n=1 Tax=Pseudomonas putida TaxID=303 RepID=UPI001F09F9F6
MIKSIATVEGADVGKFEQLTLDKTPVSTSVTDEPGTPGNEGDLVKSPSRLTRPRWPRTSSRPSPYTSTRPGSRPGRDPEQQAQVTIKAGETSAPYTPLRRAMTSTTTLARSAWASRLLWM